MTVASVLQELKEMATPGARAAQEYFGIREVNSLGLRTPQLRAFAKRIGRDQDLALSLWDTGVHEARHIAIFIADPKSFTVAQAEKWLQDFSSWDIVDNCCSTLFEKMPGAFEKAIEWTSRSREFEKRAGFVMMAVLAVHDKRSEDEQFERFFPHLIAASADERNFVKKAVNWALRQIGKRNERLCRKAIAVAKEIREKDDPASRWIAADALRELERYLQEGKIRNIGRTT